MVTIEQAERAAAKRKALRNPQAFPTTGDNYLKAERAGLTLRDYFAAKAMQSILAREHGRSTTTLEFVGNHAYQYADAMLKARSE
jgi:hypothetical protein